MTSKRAYLWLSISGVMIIISIILLVIPVSPRRPVSAPDSAPTSTGDRSRAVVTRIIDGDTYVLSDGSQVRLIGLDTPERGQPFYEQAKVFAESTVLGETVTLVQDEEPLDSYGRMLTYLFLDTLLINEKIVREGLGSVYLFEKNKRYAGKLISAQKRARDDQAGIWSLAPPPEENYYVNIHGSFRFHRPLCPNVKDSPPDRLRRFGSRDDALDLGLSPCRFCRP